MVEVDHCLLISRTRFLNGCLRAGMPHARLPPLTLAQRQLSYLAIVLLVLLLPFPVYASATGNSIALRDSTATPIVISPSQDWYGTHLAAIRCLADKD